MCLERSIVSYAGRFESEGVMLCCTGSSIRGNLCKSKQQLAAGGGSAVVYRGRDRLQQRDVALKVQHLIDEFWC